MVVDKRNDDTHTNSEDHVYASSQMVVIVSSIPDKTNTKRKSCKFENPHVANIYYYMVGYLRIIRAKQQCTYNISHCLQQN